MRTTQPATASVRSVWVWRGFLFMALIGLGISISLFSAGNTAFGAAWVFIAAGWLSISMWLWRRHVVSERVR